MKKQYRHFDDDFKRKLIARIEPHPTANERKLMREAELRDKIEYVQSEYSCYGHRTVKAQLRRHYGLVVNRKRLPRIMRLHNLFRQIKKRFTATMDSNHGYPVYPNPFKGLEVTGINQVWVADITYIRILTGFVHLAVIPDVFSRRVIGRALSKSIRHELTVATLKMAIANSGVHLGGIQSETGSLRYPVLAAG